MQTAVIHPGAKIAPDCQIGEYCIIEDGVTLEAQVILGHHVVIHAGTRIGSGTRIGDHCVLGVSPAAAVTSTIQEQELPPTVIGSNCILGNGVVVYRGTELKDSCFCGDYASVRENCLVDSFALIGRGVVVENNVKIGAYSKIQTGAYITAGTKLADHVFIAPMVTTTNDNYMGRTEKRFAARCGPSFARGCRVGGGATILPGVSIGEESFVAAGSMVTRDVPPYRLVMGIPARVSGVVPSDELLAAEDSQQHNCQPVVDDTIPSFDLKRQNLLLEEEISCAVQDVISSGQFILGENVLAIENDVAALCGARYGIGVGNGSDALYLALLACGIGPGDEVITTPFTFFATAGAIIRAGAVPVFADIDPCTYNIDPAEVAAKITPHTKAILPVHLYGQPAEMGELLELARRYNLKLIEDAAQSIAASLYGKPVAGIGDAGCLSFFPTKNLGCFGDGGMIVTNDPDLAARARILRVHGSSRKYHHELPGINSRLDEIQAAVLRVKLPYLPEWIKKRQEHACLYNQFLKATGLIEKGFVRIPYHAPDRCHVYHQYTIAVQDRDRLQNYLREKGISTTVYYPLSLHLQPVFSGLGYSSGDLPNSEQASQTVLSLPMFPELQEDEITRVVQEINNFFGDEVR